MRAGWFGSRTKLAIGAALVAGMCLVALLAPLIAPHDPYAQSLMLRLQPPAWMEGGEWAYPLGTDNFGRDLLSRLIYGSRLSITVGLCAMALGLVVGALLGLVAGYVGGRTEQLIMRFADAYQAVPDVLLAIVVVAVFGGGIVVLILVLGLSGWETYTRIVFNSTRSLRERGFVEAATAAGAGGGYIMRRHILPQIVPMLTVIATLQVAQIILQETALSFLGLGLPPPTATWGNILAEGRDRLLVAPWIANLAGCAIILLVLGINLLGNGLREALDPMRSRQR
ncbi:ABC transporter permease [Verticiella sediminum]|uniref:ABC transporter permease n=1 Tax=Verticiella sediminum TaxID=1247510 RepID=A0A556A812_9BURK|nr:ABC transporter permease [Verticiella sediminum]TSH89026.1 ABC transporter permease [Verticiella sediminum]